MATMEDMFDKWLDSRPADEVPSDGELLPGTRVGACKVVALLGRGGFAEVYRGEDADGRPVAIKILQRLDEKSRARFELETKILLRVRHPNFPQMVSFGSCGELPKCWRNIYLTATNSDPAIRYRTVEKLGEAIRRRHWRKAVALISTAAVAAVPHLGLNAIGDLGLVTLGEYAFSNPREGSGLCRRRSAPRADRAVEGASPSVGSGTFSLPSVVPAAL